NFPSTSPHTNAAALHHRPHHKISAEREPLVRPHAHVCRFGQKPAPCSNRSLRKGGDSVFSSQSNNNRHHRMARARFDRLHFATALRPRETPQLWPLVYLN